MRVLSWPGPEIKKHSPDYEWAYMKAYLDNVSDESVFKTYAFMFGKPAKSSTPVYLVQLAIQYGALNLGYERTGKKQPPIEKVVFACVSQLDETAFKNNKSVFRYCQTHDTEEVEFQRKLVYTEG